MKTEVAQSASDRRGGLTIGELQSFINASLLQGIDPRTAPQVRVGFRGQLTEIKAAGDLLDRG